MAEQSRTTTAQQSEGNAPVDENWCHTRMLVTRSVVFASMFEYEMEERENNLVEITNLDYETMRETVRFMYTDQAPNIDAKAEDLLAAANEYGLGRLKALCEKALSSKVCAETAATLLFLADMHSADQLKRLVMDFVKTRVKDVMVTSGWKTLTQRRPQLIDEVFRAFAIERCLRETCQQDG
ncbi:speckle-type POZ protein-like [Haemaphysalis longicornis]